MDRLSRVKQTSVSVQRFFGAGGASDDTVADNPFYRGLFFGVVRHYSFVTVLFQSAVSSNSSESSASGAVNSSNFWAIGTSHIAVTAIHSRWSCERLISSPRIALYKMVEVGQRS